MIKKAFVFVFLLLNFVSLNAQNDTSKFAEAVRAASQSVAKETAKEMRDTFIGTETSLSYKYQVIIAICLGVLTIVVIIVGFIQWKSAERQHQLFKDSITSIKDEASSVKDRAKESFTLSQEILSISKKLIEQEISELNLLREAKGKFEQQLEELQRKNNEFLPANELELKIITEIEKHYDKPNEIKKDCQDFAIQTEQKLTKILEELRDDIKLLKDNKNS